MGENAEPQKSDVQTIPGQIRQCLHQEIEEISTLLAGSTRVLRRVTRQGGLTQLDYCFHVNAYKHLTAKGLPATVIQPGVKSTRARVKRPYEVHSAELVETDYNVCQIQTFTRL